MGRKVRKKWILSLFFVLAVAFSISLFLQFAVRENNPLKPNTALAENASTFATQLPENITATLTWSKAGGVDPVFETGLQTIDITFTLSQDFTYVSGGINHYSLFSVNNDGSIRGYNSPIFDNLYRTDSTKAIKFYVRDTTGGANGNRIPSVLYDFYEINLTLNVGGTEYSYTGNYYLENVVDISENTGRQGTDWGYLTPTNETFQEHYYKRILLPEYGDLNNEQFFSLSYNAKQTYASNTKVVERAKACITAFSPSNPTGNTQGCFYLGTDGSFAKFLGSDGAEKTGKLTPQVDGTNGLIRFPLGNKTHANWKSSYIPKYGSYFALIKGMSIGGVTASLSVTWAYANESTGINGTDLILHTQAIPTIKTVRYSTNYAYDNFTGTSGQSLHYIVIEHEFNAYQEISDDFYNYIKLVDKDGRVIPSTIENSSKANGTDWYTISNKSGTGSRIFITWQGKNSSGAVVDKLGTNFDTEQVGAKVIIKSGLTKNCFVFEGDKEYTVVSNNRTTVNDSIFNTNVTYANLTAGTSGGTITANNLKDVSLEVTQTVNNVTGVQASNGSAVAVNSSNPAVATVTLSNGTLSVVGKGEGSAVISLTANGCFPKTFVATVSLGTLNVIDPLNPNNTDLIIGIHNANSYTLTTSSKYMQEIESCEIVDDTSSIIQSVTFTNVYTEATQTQGGEITIIAQNDREGTAYVRVTATGCPARIITVYTVDGTINVKDNYEIIRGGYETQSFSISNLQEVSVTNNYSEYFKVDVDNTNKNIKITALKGTYNLGNGGRVSITLTALGCNPKILTVYVKDVIQLSADDYDIDQGKFATLSSTNVVNTPITYSVSGGANLINNIVIGTAAGTVRVTASAAGCNDSVIEITVSDTRYYKYKVTYQQGHYEYFNDIVLALNARGVLVTLEQNAENVNGYSVSGTLNLEFANGVSLNLTAPIILSNGSTVQVSGSGSITNASGTAIIAKENSNLTLSNVAVTGVDSALEVGYTVSGAIGAVVKISNTTLKSTAGSSINITSNSDMTNRAKITLENVSFDSASDKDILNTARCYDISLSGNGNYKDDSLAQWIGGYGFKKVGENRVIARNFVKNLAFTLVAYNDKPTVINAKINLYNDLPSNSKVSLKIVRDNGTVVSTVEDITTLNEDNSGRYLISTAVDAINYCDKLTYEFTMKNESSSIDYVWAVNYSVVDYLKNKYQSFSNELKEYANGMCIECDNAKKNARYRTDYLASEFVAGI